MPRATACPPERPRRVRLVVGVKGSCNSRAGSLTLSLSLSLSLSAWRTQRHPRTTAGNTNEVPDPSRGDPSVTQYESAQRFVCKRRTNVTEQIGVDSDPIGALKRGQVIFAIAEATLPSVNGKDVPIQRLKFRVSTEDRKFGWVSAKARDGKTGILVLESEDLTKIDQIDRTDSERYTRERAMGKMKILATRAQQRMSQDHEAAMTIRSPRASTPRLYDRRYCQRAV